MTYKYDKLVGIRISQFRNAANLTQEQLSAKLQVRGCDLTRSAIAKIEVGQRHIYLFELILIKDILNIDYEDLLKDLE